MPTQTCCPWCDVLSGRVESVIRRGHVRANPRAAPHSGNHRSDSSLISNSTHPSPLQPPDYMVTSQMIFSPAEDELLALGILRYCRL